MTKEKSIRAQKEFPKETIPIIYIPVICLLVIGEILKVQIREEIYYSIVNQ